MLAESEIQKCVQVDQEAIAAMEDGVAHLAKGGVTLPPILRVDVADQGGKWT